jgi:putative ABC transport system ATP-binding protein
MIELTGITKSYVKNGIIYPAIERISFILERGDFCSIIGASGAGKSTLLSLIGGLIHPDSGTVSFNGKDIYKLKTSEINKYRKKHLGFMFQQFHLMPYLTIFENIRLACHTKEQSGKMGFYLDKCGLADLQKKYPSELSVGEKQRTAFVRAIISDPDLLLADEPTGNLDSVNSGILLELVREFNKNGGTVIMASHDPGIVRYASRTIRLEKGRLVD